LVTDTTDEWAVEEHRFSIFWIDRVSSDGVLFISVFPFELGQTPVRHY